MNLREEILHDIDILDTSQDRESIAAAAISLAGSGDDEAIAGLGKHLQQNEFLARLDDITNPQTSIYNLHYVFGALERNPSPATGQLCVDLMNEPDFVAEPARLNYLLPALAAVSPTSEAAASVFRRTNVEGFYHVNAPRLVHNGSPLALAVFEEMIESSNEEPMSRVDAIHRSVLPRRTDLAVLQTCGRLLDKGLEPEVEVGLVESLFDYQERKWFGNARPLRPPSWDSTSTETLRFALDLASRVQGRKDLPPELEQAINNTLLAITGIIAERELQQ